MKLLDSSIHTVYIHVTSSDLDFQVLDIFSLGENCLILVSELNLKVFYTILKSFSVLIKLSSSAVYWPVELTHVLL